MFAIIRLGNQQFKVQAGDFVRAPFQQASVKDKIDIPVVAFGGAKDFVCDKSGLKGSKVKALVLRQSLAPKVLVFKKKRRKGYRKTRGHRQKVTELKILELFSPDGKVSKVDSDKKSASKKTGTAKKESKAQVPKKTTGKKVSKAPVKKEAKASAKKTVKAKASASSKNAGKKSTKK